MKLDYVRNEIARLRGQIRAQEREIGIRSRRHHSVGRDCGPDGPLSIGNRNGAIPNCQDCPDLSPAKGRKAPLLWNTVLIWLDTEPRPKADS